METNSRIEYQARKKILKKYTSRILKKEGVVAVGIGPKIVKGNKQDYDAIVVSVKQKKPLDWVKKKDQIPVRLSGFRTDVIETGTIKALHTFKHRPAMGGISIGHINITAGTFGCLVKKGSEILILSNNHVLACSNDANIGDKIVQPGIHDSGKDPEDIIASLVDFVPIEMSGGSSDCRISKVLETGLNYLAQKVRSHTRFKSFKVQQNSNFVDAAIASPINSSLVSSEIMDVGRIESIYEPAKLGMNIKKSGRTTGLTEGTIDQIDVTVNVQYGEGKMAIFTDQIIAGKMCAGGDSGSLVLSKDNYPTGLLFAGSENISVINRIEYVMDLLGIHF